MLLRRKSTLARWARIGDWDGRLPMDSVPVALLNVIHGLFYRRLEFRQCGFQPAANSIHVGGVIEPCKNRSGLSVEVGVDYVDSRIGSSDLGFAQLLDSRSGTVGV